MRTKRQLVPRLLAIVRVSAVSVASLLALGVAIANAGTIEMTSCSGFSDGGYDAAVSGLVWQGVNSADFSTSNHCPQGGSFQILPSGVPKRGENVQWNTVTPPSIEIVHAVTPVNEVLIDPTSGNGFKASFFWRGGTQAIWPVNSCCGGMYYGAGINRSLGPSRWFGWQVMCSVGTCGQPLQILDVRGIDLTAVDNTPPALLALGSNNIWYQSGRWVRGSGWPASFAASDDSGICAMQATVAGQAIAGPSDPTRNTHSWTQCPTPQTMGLTIDTTQYPNGAVPLTLSASDAANPANASSSSETLHVDNAPVDLSLSGPTDARSTAGTQYVTATASAGPSGVGIACSLDGSPYQWHPGSSTRVAVSGVGTHQVLCYAQNGAFDSSGNPAHTATKSWTLKVGLPTVMGIGFTRVVDALRCHRSPERVNVAARWVTVHRHHRLVEVQKRSSFKIVKVTRCHVRTARRWITVWSTVSRHGEKVQVEHKKLVRVVLLPHVVDYATRRVAHGRGANISGWLGTAGGNSLGGQVVRILTAPDNGAQQFTQTATATTAANGSWTARIQPGPSRLVIANYGGGGTVESAQSGTARLIVPASAVLRVDPTVTHWGGQILLSGRLTGGYIPPAGELVVLWIGWPGGSTEIGHLYTGLDGRFTTKYTFLRGNGTETYRLWAASARESDYPYAPASSRRVRVVVGP